MKTANEINRSATTNSALAARTKEAAVEIRTKMSDLNLEELAVEGCCVQIVSWATRPNSHCEYLALADMDAPVLLEPLTEEDEASDSAIVNKLRMSEDSDRHIFMDHVSVLLEALREISACSFPGMPS